MASARRVCGIGLGFIHASLGNGPMGVARGGSLVVAAGWLQPGERSLVAATEARVPRLVTGQTLGDDALCIKG